MALLAVILAAALPAQAAGPWRATIIDADTGKPLESVVVVAAFTKYTASLGGWAGGEYYGSDEVVTGPDGRFEIPARNLWNPIRWFTEVRLELVMFKPGYGRERPRKTEATRAIWEKFESPGIPANADIVLEMPRLKTRQERMDFCLNLRVPPRVPLDRQRAYREAMKQEEAYLGFK